jgi:hypothetical protein
MPETATKNLVLGKIAADHILPTDLLVLLDQGLSYADIQEAVSELLYEGRIVLTPERQLVVARGSTRLSDDAKPEC